MLSNTIVDQVDENVRSSSLSTVTQDNRNFMIVQALSLIHIQMCIRDSTNTELRNIQHSVLYNFFVDLRCSGNRRLYIVYVSYSSLNSHSSFCTHCFQKVLIKKYYQSYILTSSSLSSQRLIHVAIQGSAIHITSPQVGHKLTDLEASRYTTRQVLWRVFTYRPR